VSELISSFLQALSDNELIVAGVIGSFAYILRGWMERNREILEARTEHASVVAKEMHAFYGALGGRDQSQIEHSLRTIKAALPSALLFMSRRTEKKALVFLNYGNALSQMLYKEELPTDMQFDNVNNAASNFLDSLRRDVLGMSRYGIAHKIATLHDRSICRRREGKKK
jgi:hypothetical protein